MDPSIQQMKKSLEPTHQSQTNSFCFRLKALSWKIRKTLKVRLVALQLLDQLHWEHAPSRKRGKNHHSLGRPMLALSSSMDHTKVRPTSMWLTQRLLEICAG